MYFLIGVILFIVFVVILFFSIWFRIRKTLDRFGYAGKGLEDIIRDARLEDQEVPKSLSSMDSIYLRQIQDDFKDLNVQELKRESEKVILDCFHAIEKKNASSLKGKIKSFVEKKIQENGDRKVHYNQLKFHNTVISDYHRERGVATIYFSSALEYFLEVDGHSVKTQDRIKTEFIYVVDESLLPRNMIAFGIHCPNCGAPVSMIGDDHICSYCGTSVFAIIGKVFTCNDVISY